jgi:hypothetical protein
MSLPHDGTWRLPAPSTTHAAPSALPAGSTPGLIVDPMLLAGQVGAEVASSLSSALERVRLLAETGRIGQRSLLALQEEIERARRIAMLGQQVSRLAAGSVRQAPEMLELPQMLRDAVGQRGDEIAARGIEVRQRLQPAAVSVDPSLLFALLLSLIDWAFEHCRAPHLRLSTGLNNWPVHALLQCEFAWRPADRLHADGNGAAGEAEIDLDTMAWRLVEQAARAMGVRIDRRQTLMDVRLTLSFPEAPRRWPKLVDGLQALDDPYAMSTQPLAGSQVMVLAESVEVRRVVRNATAEMGLEVDYVSTLAEAREGARRAMPDVLIVDARGHEIDRLLGELKAGDTGPALVHIQVQGGENVAGLEVTTRAGFEILSVDLAVALRELPVALRYALSRA